MVLKRMWNSFYFLIILTMLIWAATASVSAHLFQQGLTPEEVTTMDILLAFVSLLAITLTIPESRRSLRQYRWKHVPKLVLLSLLGIFLYDYFLFRAYSSDPNNVPPYAIVNYMWPLTTILFGVVILREKPTVYTWIGGIVGFLGFLLIQFSQAFETPAVQSAWAEGDLVGTGAQVVWSTFGDAKASGCLLAFAGAVMWGIFGPLGKKWAAENQFDPLSSMLCYVGIGLALCLVFFGPGIRWGWIFSRWYFVLSLFWVGVLAHGVANILWLRTIAVGGAGRTGVVAYVTPVLALTYIAIFHHQTPPVYSAVGLGLILGAVALAESHRQSRKKPDGA